MKPERTHNTTMLIGLVAIVLIFFSVGSITTVGNDINVAHILNITNSAGLVIGSYIDGYSCSMASYCIYTPWYSSTTIKAKNGTTQMVESSSTDATTVINYATSNAPEGGSVIFQSGNTQYSLSSTVFINKSLTFGTYLGVPRISTTANPNIGVQLQYTGSDGGNGIVVNCETPCTASNKGRVRLQGFAIIGKGSASGTGTGIIINGSTVAGAGLDKTLVEQVAIMDWKGNGMWLTGNVYESTVRDSVFQNNSLDGFRSDVPAPSATGEFLLQNVRADNNLRNGVNITAGVSWELSRVTASLNGINGFNFSSMKGSCISCMAESNVRKGFDIESSTTGITLISPQVSYPIAGGIDNGIFLGSTTQKVTIIGYYAAGATIAKDLYFDGSSNLNTVIDPIIPNGYTDVNCGGAIGCLNTITSGGSFTSTLTVPLNDSGSGLGAFGFNGSMVWTGGQLCIRSGTFPVGAYKCATFT